MKPKNPQSYYFGATKNIFENAIKLRQPLTEAEKLLWENLRNRKLLGLKFRRQHPIDQYIADFYCNEKKLVIELDGGIHNNKEAKEYDDGRTYEMEQYGLKVIRFTNEEVTKNMKMVLEKIREILKEK